MNLDSRKGQEGLLEKVDSNPYAMHSYLNSNKFCLDEKLRRTSEKSEVRFKSLIQRFESLDLEL